jgi:hypothetical protein
MQKSKYAKVKIIYAMLKSLTANFTLWRGFSVLSPPNRTSPVLLILRVHQSALEMKTLMVAPLVMVTLMMMPHFLSRPAWSVNLSLTW